MTNHDQDDATDVVELAAPLRPSPAVEPPAQGDAPVADLPIPTAPVTRAGTPSKLRVGVVSGAAVALAVGAVATSFAATPTKTATTTTGSTPTTVNAISQVPLALDPVLDEDDLDGDLGRMGGGGFRDITISAISGSSITLKTADGWTRTITVTADTDLSKGGQDIAVGDLAVGDQVRFRQEKNDDGTYTVTAIAVVVPRVSGTVSDLNSTSFKLTTRDGSVWTITTNGSTVYRYGAADGTRADIANGDKVLVLGESSGDNALTASSVAVAGDRVAGTVTAKTADTITIKKRDGSTVTVHVSSDTTYRLPGVTDPGLDDVTVDMVIGVSGRDRTDGSIDAAAVAAGKGRGHGLGRGGFGGFGGPEDAPANDD